MIETVLTIKKLYIICLGSNRLFDHASSQNHEVAKLRGMRLSLPLLGKRSKLNKSKP